MYVTAQICYQSVTQAGIRKERVFQVYLVSPFHLRTRLTDNRVEAALTSSSPLPLFPHPSLFPSTPYIPASILCTWHPSPRR